MLTLSGSCAYRQERANETDETGRPSGCDSGWRLYPTGGYCYCPTVEPTAELNAEHLHVVADVFNSCDRLILPHLYPVQADSELRHVIVFRSRRSVHESLRVEADLG